MKVSHNGTVEHPSGLIDVTVTLHKKYIYVLQSDYAYQKFLKELRHNKHGAALNVLKKFDCRKEIEDAANKTKS